MSDKLVASGLATVGKRTAFYPSRTFPIQTKDFTDAQQSVPVMVGAGFIKTAGVTFTPIWNFVPHEQTTKAGK